MLIIFLISFIITGSYKGIIRPTGLRDALNVIIAAFIACAVLALLALLNRNLKYFEYLTIPISILTIHFLINIVVFISSTFLFKQFYYLLFYGIKKERHVLIYGAREADLITYSFLSGDKDAKVFVVGFLDNDSKKIGRRLNGSVILLFKKSN